LILNYFFDGLSHLQLPLAGTETGHDLRKRAGSGEDGSEIRHCASLSGLSVEHAGMTRRYQVISTV
jgi:hypothetical protein